ncbi:Protein dpy-30 [Rhizophlyctis rosea]|uniref:Protein dpy-30 n=1 Tax=Rhizophlyctis rosea TaxID=64517 RepID=A0AAD5WWT9_9FUNG|nr:Protein dpy-30 [Rhizophlyctis rosea]
MLADQPKPQTPQQPPTDSTPPSDASQKQLHEPFGLTKELEDILNGQRTNIINIDKDHLQGLPARAYLDQTVVPVLIEGLRALTKERYLAR